MSILKIFKLVVILVILLGLLGCGSEDSSGPSANIEFTWGEFGTKSYGAPYVIFKIQHKGGDDIYSAHCDVMAMKGSSIMDTGFAYFADGGTIRSGENAQAEAVFFNLSSHSQYEIVEARGCTWLYR
jgi:hypothetical protein